MRKCKIIDSAQSEPILFYLFFFVFKPCCKCCLSHLSHTYNTEKAHCWHPFLLFTRNCGYQDVSCIRFESYFCLPYAPERLTHTAQQLKECILTFCHFKFLCDDFSPCFLGPFHLKSYSTLFMLSVFQADMSVEAIRQHFQESSLEYVCKLQEIQERKKFECVEPVSAWPFVQIVIQLDSFQHCLPVDSIWYALTYHKNTFTEIHSQCSINRINVTNIHFCDTYTLFHKYCHNTSSCCV